MVYSDFNDSSYGSFGGSLFSTCTLDNVSTKANRVLDGWNWLDSRDFDSPFKHLEVRSADSVEDVTPAPSSERTSIAPAITLVPPVFPSPIGPPSHLRPASKRRLTTPSPPPSPNTAKEAERRGNETRRLLRMTMGKLRCMPEPDSSLRRAVLLTNTARHLQTELRLQSIRPCKRVCLDDTVPAEARFVLPPVLGEVSSPAPSLESGESPPPADSLPPLPAGVFSFPSSSGEVCPSESANQQPDDGSGLRPLLEDKSQDIDQLISSLLSFIAED